MKNFPRCWKSRDEGFGNGKSLKKRILERKSRNEDVKVRLPTSSPNFCNQNLKKKQMIFKNIGDLLMFYRFEMLEGFKALGFSLLSHISHLTSNPFSLETTDKFFKDYKLFKKNFPRWRSSDGLKPISFPNRRLSGLAASPKIFSN